MLRPGDEGEYYTVAAALASDTRRSGSRSRESGYRWGARGRAAQEDLSTAQQEAELRSVSEGDSTVPGYFLLVCAEKASNRQGRECCSRLRTQARTSLEQAAGERVERRSPREATLLRKRWEAVALRVSCHQHRNYRKTWGERSTECARGLGVESEGALVCTVQHGQSYTDTTERHYRETGACDDLCRSLHTPTATPRV